jgi:heme/copper-type cytochrome/quinol oxidase subunit 1
LGVLITAFYIIKFTCIAAGITMLLTDRNFNTSDPAGGGDVLLFNIFSGFEKDFPLKKKSRCTFLV